MVKHLLYSQLDGLSYVAIAQKLGLLGTHKSALHETGIAPVLSDSAMSEKLRLDPVSEQSIDWMVKRALAYPDAALQERFNAWLAADPAHARVDTLQKRLGGSFNTVRALDSLPGQAGEARCVLLQPSTLGGTLCAGRLLLGGAVMAGRQQPVG